MKLKTKALAVLTVGALGGLYTVAAPVWTSETGKPGAKPASTADRKSVTFVITFTPASGDFGPQVVAYEWHVGQANGSGVVSTSGAVIDTHRGRRGEVVTFSAAARKDRKGFIVAQYLDAEAFYGGLPFGPNCSIDARGGGACSIVAHVPAT